MHKMKSGAILFLLVSLCASTIGCAAVRDPISVIQQNCLTIEPAANTLERMRGTLLLESGFDVYLYRGELPMQTLYSVDSMEATLGDFDISPDRQKLVFAEMRRGGSKKVSYYHLILVLPDGGYEDVLSWPVRRGSLIGWLDNERVVLERHDLPFGTITLFNPVTGESEDIQPSFAELYDKPFYNELAVTNRTDNLFYFLNDVQWFPIIYDRSMSRAFLYLSDSGGMRYALWNAESRSVLWERRVYSPYAEPQWSPDGEHLLVTMRPDPAVPWVEEFYLIDRDGGETQLTDLGAHYDSFFIGRYSWSPDGRYIASWGLGSNLAVLDLEENRVIDYCIGPVGMLPIWSPDSTQIAVRVSQRTEQSNYHTVVIDIENNTAFSISEDRMPIGWLQSIP